VARIVDEDVDIFRRSRVARQNDLGSQLASPFDQR
jgi:hypothetical protein